MNKRSFLKIALLTLAGGAGVAEPALAAKPVVAAITEQDVLQAQQAWAKGIVEIG